MLRKGNSRRRCGRAFLGVWEAQPLSEWAFKDPEPAVGGGSGEAQAFLDADLVVYILRAASFHRDERNPTPTKLR
jgi:hypothetical protein